MYLLFTGALQRVKHTGITQRHRGLSVSMTLSVSYPLCVSCGPQLRSPDSQVNLNAFHVTLDYLKSTIT